MKTLLNRHSPLALRTVTLRNRVIIPPMASETATTSGLASERTVAHYTRLSEARVGLIIVEYSFVHASGRSEEFQLGAHVDDTISGLTAIREVIEASGAVPGLQLTHSGGKSERCFAGNDFMSPSGVAVPIKGREPEIPRSMSSNDISLWRKAFSASVGRAVKAGFKLVEFHAAHGYGLNQFLSPAMNLRTDAYGGNLTKNARLLFEIVEDARSQYPQLLLSVRIPGQDFISGGLTSKDSSWIAQELEARGVDIIHVSSGLGGWRRPGTRDGEGYLMAEASTIQKSVRVPVIGVGGIETGSYIDSVIASQTITLAAVGRAILKAPSEWSRLNLEA